MKTARACSILFSLASRWLPRCYRGGYRGVIYCHLKRGGNGVRDAHVVFTTGNSFFFVRMLRTFILAPIFLVYEPKGRLLA